MSDDETTRQVESELLLLRRVVARHISDGIHSGVPAAELLARSLLTEIEMAGLRVDAPDGVTHRECDNPACSGEGQVLHVVMPCGALVCTRCGFEFPRSAVGGRGV